MKLNPLLKRAALFANSERSLPVVSDLLRFWEEKCQPRFRERSLQHVDDSYVQVLATAVTGDLGNRTGAATSPSAI